LPARKDPEAFIIGVLVPDDFLYPHTQRFRHAAMATLFEIYLIHPDAGYARQAAREAFDLLDRLESVLSRYIESSDIFLINHLPPGQTAVIGLDAFECLKQCRQLCEETGGAFDVTLGGWIERMKREGTGVVPGGEAAFFPFGFAGLELEEETHRVLRREALEIDLGGFGKGYALDRMAELLGEWDVDTALLHGGWSTVLALEPPPESAGWRVSISHPVTGEVIRHFELKQTAVSASGLGKGRHILDPRTLQPVTEERAAWSGAPTAACADALSTAFMIMTRAEIELYLQSHPQTWAVLVDLSDSPL
jgi:thiamine biosynthesis lipoprotein